MKVAAKMKFDHIIFILGSGAFARELKTYIVTMRSLHPSRSWNQIQYDPLGDNEIYLVADDGDGDITVKEYHAKINSLSNTNYYSIIGSGKCDIKARMLEEIRGPIMSFIHPRATVCPTSIIGKGTVLAPGCVISPHAVLGDHVLANYNCTIGHNTTVGDLSVISPNSSIGGSCNIGDRVFIGSGASIKENITVGNDVVVGMGSVAIKDVPAGLTVVGNPARPLEKKSVT